MTGLEPGDRLGLVAAALDAHTMGLRSVRDLMADCGIAAVIAPDEVREAVGRPDTPDSGAVLARWIRSERITALGFSWRLDPETGASAMLGLAGLLRDAGLLARDGGPVRALHFAGLPRTCELVRERCPWITATFAGDETPAETLAALGVPRSRLPAAAARGAAYDEARMSFAERILADGKYRSVARVDRSGSPLFGLRGDRLSSRVDHGTANGLPPLMRAHVGPYLPNRREAVDMMEDWTRRLAGSGLLDVLSIGTSQLSQSRFGDDWGDEPDGGGVPIAKPAEYERIWKAARPMLVRTYAGTRDVPALARMYEERIDIAWHALSLWWFCAIDGRGPNPVRANLDEHEETLRYIAKSGKPFEPNVPHHFSFRGADDVTCVAAGYLAARFAHLSGVRELVLQTMLNTPKSTWGIQDLAKARALLAMVRGLEGPGFRVYLQPRGGLDYFAADERKAKLQLAAVTALMDDIEPYDASSPQVIHVVGWSEAIRLADPEVVDESVRITRYALERYRAARRAGEVDDMGADRATAERATALESDARALVAGIEAAIPDTYTPAGLYEALASGFLAAPGLDRLRDEFAAACAWTTRTIDGSVRVVDAEGRPVTVAERVAACADNARKRRTP